MGQGQRLDAIQAELCYRPGGLEAGAGQQQHELFPAITGRHLVCPAHTARQGLGYQAQAVVACHMAVMVVVELEMVDVHQQQGQWRLLACTPVPFVGQALVEMPAVANAGECVRGAELGQLGIRRGQLLLLVHQLGHVGAHTGNAAAAGAPLMHPQPALVGQLLQGGGAGRMVFVHTLGDPAVLLALCLGELAGLDAMAQHFLEALPGAHQRGHQRVDLAELGIAGHQAVVLVIEGKSLGQGLDGVFQQLPGHLRLDPRGVQLLPLLHQLGDVEPYPDHVAAGRAGFMQVDPAAIGVVAQLGTRMLPPLRQQLGHPVCLLLRRDGGDTLRQAHPDQLLIGLAQGFAHGQVGHHVGEVFVVDDQTVLLVVDLQPGWHGLQRLV